MISGLYKFLSIVLVLLQLVVPLVHAHSDDSLTLESLHIPELEALSVHHDSSSLMSTYQCDNKHIVIDIENGIKHRNATLTDNVLNYLHAPVPVAKLTVFSSEINFSPQPTSVIKNILINSQPPRTPPFL